MIVLRHFARNLKFQTFAMLLTGALFLLAVRVAALAQQSNAPASQFQFKKLNDKSLGLWEGDRPVLVYNHGDIEFQARNRIRKRASYVHPIYGLDGEVLTDDFPADHYHHHGLFWCWPHVTIGNRHYDFWERDDIEIKFERWLDKETNSDRATLAVENAWLAGERRVMKEELQLIVHPVAEDSRNIDVTLTWTPIDEAITLRGAEEKSYGGVSLRFAPRTDTFITVPTGRASNDLLITNLPWADLSAKFEGAAAPSGAALFVHPSHAEFPPEWMTRDYGLLAVGWPGVNAKTLPAGKPVTCRYRIWIHRGRPQASQIQSAYDRFQNQPAESTATVQ